ncbi:DUF6114 domain-containing protein, partial [Streptomyces albidoflavus]
MCDVHRPPPDTARRGSRPFWAGLLTMLGGIPIAYLPYAQLTLGQ